MVFPLYLFTPQSLLTTSFSVRSGGEKAQQRAWHRVATPQVLLDLLLLLQGGWKNALHFSHQAPCLPPRASEVKEERGGGQETKRRPHPGMRQEPQPLRWAHPGAFVQSAAAPTLTDSGKCQACIPAARTHRWLPGSRAPGQMGELPGAPGAEEALGRQGPGLNGPFLSP